MRILGGPIFDTHLELLKITLAFFRLDVPSLEILKTLPVNVFPVQSGFREKGKDNDLAAVKSNISISVPAPKTKINTHLRIRLWQRPIRIGPWSGARSWACPI